MAKSQLWETKPLEFWGFAKELRAGWQKSIESKENVVGQGNASNEISFDFSRAFPGSRSQCRREYFYGGIFLQVRRHNRLEKNE